MLRFLLQRRREQGNPALVRFRPHSVHTADVLHDEHALDSDARCQARCALFDFCAGGVEFLAECMLLNLLLCSVVARDEEMGRQDRGPQLY